MDNFGGITINHTFTKNSSNAFEYEFNTGKIDLSYNNFLIIGYELRTDYIHSYDCLKYQFEYTKSNYWISIIVSLVIIAVIILALIIFILIRKKRRDNYETIEKNITGELMDQ